MMKRALFILLAAALVCISLASCTTEKKTLHCDNCGKEVEVSADSNMDDSWILYCKDCEHALGLDEIIPEH